MNKRRGRAEDLVKNEWVKFLLQKIEAHSLDKQRNLDRDFAVSLEKISTMRSAGIDSEFSTDVEEDQVLGSAVFETCFCCFLMVDNLLRATSFSIIMLVRRNWSIIYIYYNVLRLWPNFLN